MKELLNSLSSDNLVLICIFMGFIALVLAVAIAFEIHNTNKRYKKYLKEINKDSEESNINITYDEDVKYVEEDSELEKTKAKLELNSLREKLKKEEEEKNKIYENTVSTTNVVEQHTNNETVYNIENTIEVPKPEVVVTQEEKVEPEVIEETNEYDDEDTAVISYEELVKAQKEYNDIESSYVDEKDAVISIEELEKLYAESNKVQIEDINVPVVDYEYKKVVDLPEFTFNDFKNTPYISPVYGISKTEDEIQLEQTANLEKLNDEIKKTNEFLKTLKDLKKNLE